MNWNILLVDDNPLVLQVMRDMLSLLGHVVEAFASPVDALAHLQQREDINMVITDFRMPEMNGLALIQEIRKFDAKLPILVLTAFAEDIGASKVTRYNADLMSKPIRLRELQEHIRKIQFQDTPPLPDTHQTCLCYA